MSEYNGHCLNCGAPAYAQSYCDKCSDWNGIRTCPECLDKYDAEDPIIDCFDHYEDGDVKAVAREKLTYLRKQIQSTIDKANSNELKLSWSRDLNAQLLLCLVDMAGAISSLARREVDVNTCANKATNLLAKVNKILKEAKSGV